MAENLTRIIWITVFFGFRKLWIDCIYGPSDGVINDGANVYVTRRAWTTYIVHFLPFLASTIDVTVNDVLSPLYIFAKCARHQLDFPTLRQGTRQILAFRGLQTKLYKLIIRINTALWNENKTPLLVNCAAKIETERQQSICLLPEQERFHLDNEFFLGSRVSNNNCSQHTRPSSSKICASRSFFFARIHKRYRKNPLSISSISLLLLSSEYDEFKNAYWRRIEAQRQALDTGCIKGLKSGMSAIQNILNNLLTVQQKSIPNGRFHVLYEVESSARQSSSSLDLFVLFSSTIDPHKEDGNYTLNALSHNIYMNTVLNRWTDSRFLPRSIPGTAIPSHGLSVEDKKSGRISQEQAQSSIPTTLLLAEKETKAIPHINRKHSARVTSLHIPSGWTVCFPNWFPTVASDIPLASEDMMLRQDPSVALNILP